MLNKDWYRYRAEVEAELQRLKKGVKCSPNPGRDRSSKDWYSYRAVPIEILAGRRSILYSTEWKIIEIES
jgi:hypothetical protein